jgi:aspartyl aminopeptidase
VDRNVNEALKFNQQTEFVPILGMAADELNASSGISSAVSDTAVGHHHSALLSLLAEEVSVAPENIADMELSLYDTQPSTLGNEFRYRHETSNLFPCL